MNINRKKQLDILDTLTDALGRSNGQSVEEIKEELRGEGIDVDGGLERLKLYQKDISMAAKRSVLDIVREKRVKLENQGHQFIGRFQGWTKEQFITRIKQLSGPEAGFAFRNLESMGLEEMTAILEDLELANARAREEGQDGE